MNGFSRRRLLGGAAACAAALSLPAWGRRRPDTRTDFRIGLCATSFADDLFKDAIVYEDGPIKAANMLELQRLMMARGGNEFFARLGSSRTPGPRSPEAHMVATQRRARLARSVDVAFNPEFLLCAHYGDMAGQPEPDLSGYPGIALSRPWHELGIEEMCDALRVYGKIVAREILDTGVKVNVWDIGNEVEFGIAGVAIPPLDAGIGGPGWKYKAPDAVDPEIGKMTLGRFFMMPSREQVAWGQAHLWNYTGRILAAVAEGIREVDRHARFATHASAIAALMPEVFVGFYQSLDAMGFRTWQLGVSYYPTNTKIIPDRLNRFKRTAALAMERLQRPLYIAEFGYAAGPVIYGGSSWANPVDDYPCTPDGQASFLRDLVEWGARERLLAGIRPWAPDYVGSGWQGMAMFEAPQAKLAVARPALGAIQEGLARAAQSAARARSG
jgi:arabinogalactan endo-1,4-beta-galactosidase